MVTENNSDKQQIFDTEYEERQGRPIYIWGRPVKSYKHSRILLLALVKVILYELDERMNNKVPEKTLFDTLAYSEAVMSYYHKLRKTELKQEEHLNH